MEAVGQLTGGVAHDFNNLLVVVIGNAELLLERLDPADGSLRLLASQIEQAGVRGAALTQRLLAFSRRQALKPQSVDMNRLVREMEPLLRRTLGEMIEIQTVLPDGTWTTLVDAGQTESALLNLAVNARDAMPRGGRIVIETANVRLDEVHAARAGDLRAGDYVMLAVSDTGTGMAPQIRDRAFEPFFTTKDVGKGSGLGLSMVYGFVRQSGGHATIHSEEGHGTTVKLHLPRAASPEDRAGAASDGPEELARGETVLLVEDDDAVRRTVRLRLDELGYTVIEAPNGAVAAAIVRAGTAVDIVLTDMVMPGGDGWDLAQVLWQDRPNLPILLMTGYADNAILRKVREDRRVLVLSKPFRRRDLAAGLRLMLGEATA
jgi:CheY-like chemotaxis protein